MSSRQQNRGTEFVNLMAKALQKAGWHIEQPRRSAEGGADIVARQGKRYTSSSLRRHLKPEKIELFP